MNHPVLSRIKNDLKAFVMGDRFYLHDDVNMSCRMSHNNWKEELIKLANENHWRVLELGSRAVVFGSYFRSKMTNAEYVGFDYYSGENVDVVGDVP